MNLSVEDLISIAFSSAGLIICFAVGIQLLFRKKGIKQTNLFLGLQLILYGFTLTNSLMALSGIQNQFQFLYFLPLNFSLWIGPLFYFFVQTRVNPSYEFKFKDLVHFIIPLSQFIFYLSIGFRSIEFKSWIWIEVISQYVQYIEEGLNLILGLGYIGATYFILKKYIPKSELKDQLYKWLKNFSFSLLIILSISSFYEILDWFLYSTYEINIFNISWASFPLKISYGGVSFVIAYNAYLYQDLSRVTAKVNESSANTDLEKQFYSLLRDQKAYLDPEVNLDSVAKMLGTSKNNISKMINEKDESFRSVLNKFRVEEFIKRVNSGKFDHLSFLGIAYDSGFNSKASFNRVFKAEIGTSPSQYFADNS